MANISSWKAGTTYAKGATVMPKSVPTSVPVPITNAGFESGDTAWTKGTGWAITNVGAALAGTWFAKYTGTGSANLEISQRIASPGQSITASIMARVFNVADGCTLTLRWLNSSMGVISTTTGAESTLEAGQWAKLTASGKAPPATAFVVFAVVATRTVGASVDVDNAAWDYKAPLLAARLGFRAVQPSAGVSGVVEPIWPGALGARVTDGTVIWEALALPYIEWEARPILKSGLTQPTWPTTPGAYVSDGTILWECTSRRVEDANCPRSKVVAIIASKVFAADKDIVRFSATANPLDWTTRDDAGYLPTGLQQANANDMAVLHPYRGNLCAWNASSFQMWQVDPDPSAMALLDQMDGVGSAHTLAAKAVGNDLYYLSNYGVRSVGIANATENMQSGDVGVPIDVLVQAAAVAAGTKKAISTYWPGMGQYWLCFGGDGVTAGAGGALAMTCAPPAGTTGTPYTYTYAATGGTAPYTYFVVSGALPPGLTLNASTGVLSGTPTTAGNYTWGIQVVDALAVAAFCGWGNVVVSTTVVVAAAGQRFLGTGQAAAGSIATSRPISYAGALVGAADTNVTSSSSTSIRGARRYGDQMFAMVNGLANLRVASIASITSWSDGPARPTAGSDLAICVSGARLFHWDRSATIYYLDSPADTTWTSATFAGGVNGNAIHGVTGNGTQMVAVNGYGQLWGSTNNGTAWAVGANMFAGVNRFYTSYGAIDSNGTRVVIAGGEIGIRIAYTDNNGVTGTDCTYTAVDGPQATQVKYCGSNRWLVASQNAAAGAATASNRLFKSLDNGVTFTPVTLPAIVQFSQQYHQSIAVDANSGRVVIAGAEPTTNVRRFFYSDDLIAWTEISLTGTEVAGIAEIYPVGYVA